MAAVREAVATRRVVRLRVKAASVGKAEIPPDMDALSTSPRPRRVPCAPLRRTVLPVAPIVLNRHMDLVSVPD